MFSGVECPQPGVSRTETSRCDCSLYGTSRYGAMVIEHIFLLYFEMSRHELYTSVNFTTVTECRWPLTLLEATAFVVPLEIFSNFGPILSKLNCFVRIETSAHTGTAVTPTAEKVRTGRTVWSTLHQSHQSLRVIPADRWPATRILELHTSNAGSTLKHYLSCGHKYDNGTRYFVRCLLCVPELDPVFVEIQHLSVAFDSCR